MAGGEGETPPLPVANGGEYLLSLLQRSSHLPRTPPQHPQQEHQSSLTLDSAVAAVGPTLPFQQLQQQQQQLQTPPPWFNGRDLTPPSPWPHSLSPPSQNYFNFSPGNMLPGTPIPGNYLPGNQSPGTFGDDLRRLGILGNDSVVHNMLQQKQQQQKLMFGSIPSELQSHEPLLNGHLMGGLAKEYQEGFGNVRVGGFDCGEFSSQGNLNSNRGNSDQHRWGKQHQGGNVNSLPSSDRRAPPGFASNTRGNFDRDSANRRGFGQNVDREKGHGSELSYGKPSFSGHNNKSAESELSRQLDGPGPPAGSKLHSVKALDVESSQSKGEIGGDNEGNEGTEGDHHLDELGEEMIGSLLLDTESDSKNNKKKLHGFRDKDARSDPRGLRLLSQKMRNLKSQMRCRFDVQRLNAQFLAIYESLIPAEEEKSKQKKLLQLLEKIIYKEWPNARLFLYGSCANQFGVSKSDIDVCLAFDTEINKSDVLLRLADLLEADNLQNVQALTRARVPIVKLMDPTTGISCDICINNVLAVVNTKLLRDYAQIDVRLRQLAFIVKHWAKSRGVNETYQGTLSSYAYVLMCINFLQQRRPAILPCLQRMDTTYSVTVDDIECSFFDQVDKLPKSENRETIAQLVWGFFHYWAYCHDYANCVISVRTGNVISKQEKDWTRRVGNDRHLICIEDPFETSHDLGRVVDKFSIKVLREEFERAAYIMQYDSNPCVKLFEPFVPR